MSYFGCSTASMKRLLTIALILLPFLSNAQDHRALHRQAIVIDTHNDVLSTVSMRGKKLDSDLSGQTHSDVSRLLRGGVDVQVFAIFCDERFGKDTAFKYANIEIDSLYEIVRRNPARMMMVSTPAQLMRAVVSGKLGCMMGVEGGHMIEDNPAYLDSLYKRGVRYMTLTWNNSTSWASSAKDETSHTVPNPASGLNELGRQIVRRMNALGMMVDLSHTGERTFWDAIATTTKPVIVSHSCVYSLCPHRRNLKDDQISAIGRNGGVIHMNFNAGFIDSTFDAKMALLSARHKGEIDSLAALKWTDYEIEDRLVAKYKGEVDAIRPPLSMLLDHIDYVVKLIGVDHVGIGSDFDGSIIPPLGLDDVTALPNLTRGLMQRGYSAKDIRKILGGNFLRVFAANQPGK
ncbi:MAG: rane dipeptidase [Flaviaesturariibacter sp.]|nr:rane dipeptidase [Flaviaesturariibacter sp.]